MFLRLDICLTDQVAQVLAIGIGMLDEHFFKGSVAFRDQAITQGFQLVQHRSFPIGLLAVDIEDKTDRIDLPGLKASHQFGQVLGLALASYGLVDGTRPAHFRAQIIIQGNASQLGIGQCSQGLGQLENGSGLAAQLASARAIEGVIGFILGHCASTGSGRFRCNRSAINGYRG